MVCGRDVKGVMMFYGKVRRAILAALDDGEEHLLDDLMPRLGALIPPEVAIRDRDQKRECLHKNRKLLHERPPRRELPLYEKAEIGRRSLCSEIACGMRREGTITT